MSSARLVRPLQIWISEAHVAPIRKTRENTLPRNLRNPDPAPGSSRLLSGKNEVVEIGFDSPLVGCYVSHPLQVLRLREQASDHFKGPRDALVANQGARVEEPDRSVDVLDISQAG